MSNPKKVQCCAAQDLFIGRVIFLEGIGLVCDKMFEKKDTDSFSFRSANGK